VHPKTGAKRVLQTSIGLATTFSTHPVDKKQQKLLPRLPGVADVCRFNSLFLNELIG
jgi:hypothetical protein